jgi:hypothetical protein
VTREENAHVRSLHANDPNTLRRLCNSNIVIVMYPIVLYCLSIVIATRVSTWRADPRACSVISQWCRPFWKVTKPILESSVTKLDSIRWWRPYWMANQVFWNYNIFSLKTYIRFFIITRLSIISLPCRGLFMFSKIFNNYSQVSVIARSTPASLWCKALVSFQDGVRNFKMVHCYFSELFRLVHSE